MGFEATYLPMTAGATLQQNRFAMVGAAPDYLAELAGVAGGAVAGVCVDVPEQGQPVAIQHIGECLVEAGAAFAPFSWIATDNQGRATVARALSIVLLRISGSVVVGRALEASAGAGSIVRVSLWQHGVIPNSVL